MGDLKNVLSWSHSRTKRFEECLRAYFWTYYGSWGGWDRDAEAEVRTAYMLKQMATLDMWGGDVVHSIIELALRDLQWGRTVRVEDIQRRARERMIRSWRESLKRDWEFDPKHRTNLFEHYYQDATANERSVRIRDRVNRCLENFRRSDTYADLEGAKRGDWLALEDLQSIEVAGVPVWVKLDCAYRRGDEVVVVDWKTGAAREEHRRQLEVYALYAVRTFEGIGPEDIVLRAAYLDEGREVDHVVSQDDLDELEERVRAAVDEMRAVLTDPDDNVASLDAFPQTEDRKRCRRCVFRDLCGLGALETPPT